MRCYKSLVEIEKRLNKMLSRVQQSLSRGSSRSETKRTAKVERNELNCAGDVLAFGKAKGWVR